MNKVAELLNNKASEIRASSPELIAMAMLKQAGMTEEDARVEVAQQAFEKEACTSLTTQGIDMEQAVNMVKAANISIKELQSFDLVSDEEKLVNVLEKSASYIETLTGYIATLENDLNQANNLVKEAQSNEPAPEMPATLAKFAESGVFTHEDLEALQALPEDTLTKFASVAEEPWGLGKAAGVANEENDPLLAFILS